MIQKLADKLSGMELSVLLAEDNKINQKVIQVMLNKNNIHSTLAENGEEVLRKLAASRYDLILMDVRMPVLDGLETHFPHPHIKNQYQFFIL